MNPQKTTLIIVNCSNVSLDKNNYHIVRTMIMIASVTKIVTTMQLLLYWSQGLQAVIMISPV